MPRKQSGIIDDAFKVGEYSPRICLATTLVFATAYVAFKWIWPLSADFSYLIIWALVFTTTLGAVATLRGYIHHIYRAKRLDTQRSLEDLRALTWQQFEHLVADAYRRKGYRVIDVGGPGDGGVDAVLSKDQERIAVQCKRWKTWSVGEPVMRDFLGAMTHGRFDRGIFVTVGKFTTGARKVAAKNNIELVDGDQLLALIKEAQPRSTETPLCPKCGAAMVRRTARRGSNAGAEFWGCSTYPACRATR